MVRMIEKEVFVSVISSMMLQRDIDRASSESLSGIFGIEGNCAYNNSNYLKGLMELLRLFFPKDEDGHCEIEFYCYVIDFGRCGDEYESVEDFYDRLVSEKYPSYVHGSDVDNKSLYDSKSLSKWRSGVFKR